MQRPIFSPRHRRTHPLIWCAAIFCSIAAVATIIAAVIVFISYLVTKPKVPRIGVAAAQLHAVYFDQSNLLTVQVAAAVRAENRNAKTRAGFSETNFGLSFGGRRIATLLAAPFAVEPNSLVEFNYVAESSPIPLSPDEAEEVSRSLGARGGAMAFELKGKTKARWRVWVVGSASFWLHLDCRLELPVNGTRALNYW
ncbi:NDR1/HIN1-like protein 12 [Andrographis paniculata]|uniref:NDR1/HIN1-like protein 12 n=1 Tax=Andrographis paniculata TaxID=175694 RepID=UPI0021E8520D|nr:NDR1/HIN1-like protein 12 [Andrographis paniculata]